MVYTETFVAGDMPKITIDLFGSILVGAIPWIGAIIAVILLILIIRALKSK